MTQTKLADAAAKVLAASGGQLHKDRITEILHREGLLPATGLKEREQVYNALWQEIDKNHKRPSRFTRIGGGVFGLSDHGRQGQSAPDVPESITLPGEDGWARIRVDGGSAVVLVLPAGTPGYLFSWGSPMTD